MEPEKDRIRKPLNNYIRFSGYVFQMAATILFFVLVGKYLDGYFGNEKLIITAILSVIGVGLAIYNLIRSVRNVR